MNTENTKHTPPVLAAAPDLLEALRYLDDAINEPSLDLVEASNKARAAIAKAMSSSPSSALGPVLKSKRYWTFLRVFVTAYAAIAVLGASGGSYHSAALVVGLGVLLSVIPTGVPTR